MRVQFISKNDYFKIEIDGAWTRLISIVKWNIFFFMSLTDGESSTHYSTANE